ncbi:hypothetical protein [Propioniciclava soli]|uniref:hypothetical protein n=1 Tax=Propioniciclava soli TaxID=2775081 RepID=UPI001E31BBE2|nr:hypothetical protein [Propioniciclava soli]
MTDAAPGHDAGRGETLLRWGRRSSAILDTGMSSLGNLALSVFAARTLSLPEFGLMSATLLGGLVLVGLSRALFGDPLILRHSADAPQDHRAAVADATSAALLTGLLVAPAVFGILFGVLLVAGASAATAAALAGVLGGGTVLLVAQELQRAIAYGTGRPVNACANSTAWTLGVLALLAAAHAGVWPLTPAGLLAAWVVATVPGTAIGMLLNGVAPRLAGLRPWFGRHPRLTRQLLVDFGLTQVTAEASFLLISMLAGAGQAGLLRKAQIPLAPVNVITNGLISVTQPGLVRRVAAGHRAAQIARLAHRLGAVIAGFALALGLGVALLPPSVVAVLVGEDWGQARVLVPLLAVYAALGALTACQGVALRALGRLGDQIRLRLLFVPVIVAIVALGALNGALGAATGLAVTMVLIACGWGWLLVRARRAEQAAAVNEPEGALRVG